MTGAPHPASHVLLAPVDARRAGESDPGARGARVPHDEAALPAPEAGSSRCEDSAVGPTRSQSKVWRRAGAGS